MKLHDMEITASPSSFRRVERQRTCENCAHRGPRIHRKHCNLCTRFPLLLISTPFLHVCDFHGWTKEDKEAL